MAVRGAGEGGMGASPRVGMLCCSNGPSLLVVCVARRSVFVGSLRSPPACAAEFTSLVQSKLAVHSAAHPSVSLGARVD